MRIHRISTLHWTWRIVPVLLIAAIAAGCGPSATDKFVMRAVQQGRYGDARDALSRKLEKDKASRRYMLDRMQLSLIDLADGLPESAQQSNDEIYEILRTQGINKDKTVASAVINEGVKFWKGEPFEQAMMYSYIAVEKAWRGEWDNARAAAGSSLFLLRDFGQNREGKRKSTQDIAAEANEAEAKGKSKDYIGNGYTPVKTNFTLGYLMAGIANAVLGRDAEAKDHFAEAVRLNAGLAALVGRLGKGSFNTILVVDYGLGPTKTAYGPDGAFCKFVPKYDWPSDDRTLLVSLNGAAEPGVPPACDVNVMAADHMWNNMEDVRLAKSVVGSAMVAGGGAAAAASHNRNARLIGAGVALAGLAMKASARADTQHCMILPQRVYVAAVTVAGPGTAITLQVEGDDASRVVLPGLSPPSKPDRFQLAYVRMTPNHASFAWANSGQVVYANDAHAGRVPGDDLPYILGGRCVRKPSHETLVRYQQSGHLRDMTQADLEELYRLEGIKLTLEDNGGRAGRHVLEGGDSLECPRPGTAGFARLFCQEHAPYKAHSARVREMAAKEMGGGRLAAGGR